MVLSCSTLGWVYIRVQGQETWGLKHFSMNLTFALKIGPKCENWFLKLGGVIGEIWWESDPTLAPHHSFIPWTLTLV